MARIPNRATSSPFSASHSRTSVGWDKARIRWYHLELLLVCWTLADLWAGGMVDPLQVFDLLLASSKSEKCSLLSSIPTIHENEVRILPYSMDLCHRLCGQGDIPMLRVCLFSDALDIRAVELQMFCDLLEAQLVAPMLAQCQMPQFLLRTLCCPSEKQTSIIINFR